MRQNKKRRTSLVLMTHAGVIAAVYVALTMVLQPLSYGAIQVRLSELLTILPIYTSAAVPGLAVGCFLSNLLGLSAGANPAGAWDLLFGTGATLLAAWMSQKFGSVRFLGLPLLATLPPIVVNALAVGTELYVVYGGFPWWLHVVSVAAGQAVACIVGGLLLAVTLEKTGVARRLSNKNGQFF